MTSDPSISTHHQTSTSPEVLFAPPSQEPVIRRSTLPRLAPLYIKMMFQRKPNLKRGESVPYLSAEAPLVLSDQWLADYRKICGWSEEVAIPLTAPQICATSIHTLLLADSRCPVPMLGLVHAANEIRSNSPLPINTPLIARVWLGETRWKRRGFEFDLHTTLTPPEHDRAVWAARTIVFRSVKGEGSGQKRGSRPAEDLLIDHEDAASQVISIPSDLGRRYGTIAKDKNPIHLYPITARLFGFKKPIIHGMWTLARSLSLTTPAKDLECGLLTVRFKRPLPMPSSPTFVQVKRSTTQDSTQGVKLQVLTEEKKIAIEGEFIPPL